MRVVAYIGALVLAGCASSGSGPSTSAGGERIVRIEEGTGFVNQVALRSDDAVRSSEVPVTFDTAWSGLPELLIGLGLTVGSIDQARGRVAQREARVRRIDGRRLSTYLDCGRSATGPQHADNYAVSLSYEVVLERTESESGVIAHMRVDASATPRAVRGSTLRCVSKGTLEELVFTRLAGEP